MLDADQVVERISQFPDARRYWVGFSGGLDSTVLLHLLAERRADLSAPLAAIHIHHGLQRQADDWAEHCKQLCRRLSLPYENLRVDAAAGAGESPEAAARGARYRAIAERMRPGDMLLTAHHLDDQAETLMLQLLRGAGVEGLAAMPACRAWADGWHVRPLLDQPRAVLRAWADSRQLRWIEDPSNAQTTADRNYLRHQVMPVLAARWPAVSRSLARSARHCADAAALIREQAGRDIDTTIDGQGADENLKVEALCALGESRAAHVLRRWLRGRGAEPISEKRLRDLLGQITTARSDAQVRVPIGDRQLRLYRGKLWLIPLQQAVPPAGLFEWGDEQIDTVELGPGMGRVRRVERAGGIAPAQWSGNHVQIGFRDAGLRCRPAGRDGSRSFKKIVQEAAVPPWMRDRLPLLFINGEVAAIANCCVCDPFAARRGQIGWWVEWMPE